VYFNPTKYMGLPLWVQELSEASLKAS
jgi:hypothetical protein